jgi:hypothetical protein
MLEIFGKYYYIDLDRITDKCRTGNKIIDEDNEETLEVNIFKYEVIKMCLETILSELREVDEEMGAFASNETSVAFKMAFNTLIKNQILIEEDEQ